MAETSIGGTQTDIGLKGPIAAGTANVDVEHAPVPGTAMELRGVSMAYGTNLVLDRIDLRVAAGEFLSIVGPSGCGKSTLLRLLAGLAHPSSGKLLAWGKPIESATRRCR